MVDIKEYIVKASKKIGIDTIGFTDCNPLVNLKDYLNYRKDNNIEVEFEQKDIEKRINPKLTFSDCRSIIVVGLSYNVDYKLEKQDKPMGVLSRSSWGTDYHKVLNEKIEALINEMKKKVDFQYKYFVDTGPLVERELAIKAGIGYYGKNCSIINKELGSFIFLGYILNDLPINTEANIIDEECGDCDLCIRACPTGALEGPYRLNPKKCISYLTQTKDIIPKNLRGRMNRKIYGCDTCQDVCPKNRNVKFSRHDEFIPYITKGMVNIEELLSMSNREFRHKYGHMAGSWRGRNPLKRNAIIALENMKDESNIKLLAQVKGNELFDEYINWSVSNI